MTHPKLLAVAAGFVYATSLAVAPACAQTTPTAEQMKCKSNEYVKAFRNYPDSQNPGKKRTVWRCVARPTR